MSYVGPQVSIQTAEARARAREAEAAWRQHFHTCVPCAQWVKRRPQAEGCRTGKDLRAADFQAKAALERERELDRQPWGPRLF